MQKKLKKSILITAAYGGKSCSLRIKLDLFHVKKRFTKELPKYSNLEVLFEIIQRRLPPYFPRKQRFWEKQTEGNADEGENDGKARTF